MEDGNGTMGEFVYFGIAAGLKDCINVDIHENNLLELEFACDGLRLVDSGYQELWPFVCKVHFDPDIYKPFAVAVYFGPTKPKSTEEYMRKFTEEINFLMENGFYISDRHFDVKIKCFICDTPARALFKCTVEHTGFNACERCSNKLFHIYANRAKEYLKVFFVAMGHYYGLKSQVLNSHHLIHLSDDVKNMGCSLSRITAFPFESFLGKLKKYIRTANKPLAQLCRRLHEVKLISSRQKVQIPLLVEVLKQKQNQITSIKYKQCTITKLLIIQS